MQDIFSINWIVILTILIFVLAIVAVVVTFSDIHKLFNQPKKKHDKKTKKVEKQTEVKIETPTSEVKKDVTKETTPTKTKLVERIESVKNVPNVQFDSNVDLTENMFTFTKNTD